MQKSDAKKAEKPLSGKTAMVTGGSRGIGKAIALRLAELGAAVAICGRDKAALENTAVELEKTGAKTYWQKADVTRVQEIEEFVTNSERHAGPVSILVNNAGIGIFGAVQDKTEEDWDRVLDTNLKSVFLMSRAVAPGMIARGAGDIVNISSLAGKNAFSGGALYCASKWGLQGMTACMAEDLRGFGIRVSVICPGSVATEFGRGQKDASKVLLPEDVAHAVAMVVTQGKQSFISEVDVRPVKKA